MFLGAGSSRSAGIKTAGDMIWDFKQRLYRSQKKLPPSAITDIGEPAVQRKLQAHFACVAAFAEKMRSVREHVAQSKKLSYKYQKEAWLLDALEIYCVAVSSLFAEAKLQRPSSPGFAGLLGYLADYVDSTGFRELSGDITSLKVQLASIRYDLLINSGAVTVTRYNEEPDYEAEIQDDFEKFKQGDVSDYLFKFSDFVGINHIEAGVLERVGRLSRIYLRRSTPLSSVIPTLSTLRFVNSTEKCNSIFPISSTCGNFKIMAYASALRLFRMRTRRYLPVRRSTSDLPKRSSTEN